jgi:predicted RNA-binding protein with PUA-like domain
MNYWLVKQEPEDYSWATFASEKRTAWTGVRNFQARNNLRTMEKGELVLYYHSGDQKAIVGIARVDRSAYPDPTATEGDWSAVELLALKPVRAPVTLQVIKSDPILKTMRLVRQSRLSVTPVTEEQFERVLALGETTSP